MALAVPVGLVQAAATSRTATLTKGRHNRGAVQCRAARHGRGGVNSRRQQSDDVEIFNIDSGWNVEALEDVEELLGDSMDGWSVEGISDCDSGEAVPLAVTGAAPAHDADELASENSSASSSGRVSQPARFGGRALGKAEAQVLASLPRHMVRRLEAEQREADEEREKLRPAARTKVAARFKTHQQLRIISGSAAGKRLRSPQGDQTRPMMEMVRNAVFNMIMSLYGCTGGLPDNTRWLDLFAGTGAVGIEALSRGVGECHFVEMSPWVVSNCLMPNLETCELESAAVVHTGKAEDFLRRAAQLSRFAGGPFDFMSVCPPYELVDYEEIFDLLEATPLLHEESIVVVEYPKKLAHIVRDRLGPLEKLRDRRYGRTYMAIYGPAQE